ncbi:transposase, partial [Streptococcus suis]
LKVHTSGQEEVCNRRGLPISRKERATWHFKSSQYYFETIYDLLHEKLFEQPILHADETSYNVLVNDSRLTYYWTF